MPYTLLMSMLNNTKIKHLLPKKHSQYKQGIIDPRKLNKYFNSCKNEPIIYRSGLELQFISYCENCSSVYRWASEPVAIRYFSRLDNKEQNYYPDYIIENKDGKRSIVEVKPYNQTIKPKECDSDWLKEAWVKNIDKWKAAKKFADEHGMNFIIVTEKFFRN